MQRLSVPVTGKARIIIVREAWHEEGALSRFDRIRLSDGGRLRQQW
jgi:hypothetical protein